MAELSCDNLNDQEEEYDIAIECIKTENVW